MTRDRPYPFKGKILIVDDTPDNLRLLSNTLIEQGHEVQCAITGELALIGANADPPDLILLDIKMPQMDGYTVCERLKASELTRDIPVIFLSSFDETFNKVKAFQVGGIDYITKPFQVEEVIARVETQLMLQTARLEILRLNADLEQRVRERTEELRQVNLELQASEERFRMMANVAPVLIWISGMDGRYTFVNQRWLDFTGRNLDHEMGDGWAEGIYPDDRQRCLRTYQTAFKERQSFTMEYRLKRVDGFYRWVLNTGIPLFQEDTFVGYIGSCIDIHDRKQAEKQLLYNALHDSLTDLPNRSLLMERLELALKWAKRYEDYIFAVLFLDLDRFKVVNDSLGHLVGDQLLISITHRLEHAIRATDLMARLGGDEFVILLEDVEGIHEAIRVADRILDDLKLPFWLEGREVFLTASIGVVLGSKDYHKGSDLLRDADTAMYRAKARGKARYEIFNPEMHLEALKQLHLENDLRKAIEHQQFVLYYQPIVSLKTGFIVGFEALIRWQHPLRGLVSPTEFISLAEETQLIIPMGAWVLEEACRQIKRWQTQFPGNPPLKISVNLSAQQLREVNLIDHVDRILSETNLDGSSLTLEITESMLIENAEDVITLLSQFRSRSIQISIDDFGTGYSSLSYLHRFPIHSLKIDRSFVSRIGGEGSNRDIAEVIVTLTHQLGLVAIAEGIETERQLYRLKALGCELAQGYFLSQPLTAEAAERLLKQRRLPIV